MYMELGLLSLSPFIMASLLCVMIITGRWRNDLILMSFLMVQMIGFSLLSVSMINELLILFIITSIISTFTSLFRSRKRLKTRIRRIYKMTKPLSMFKSTTISSMIVGATAIVGLKEVQDLMSTSTYGIVHNVLILLTSLFVIRGRINVEKNVIKEKRKF